MRVAGDYVANCHAFKVAGCIVLVSYESNMENLYTALRDFCCVKILAVYPKKSGDVYD